MSFNCMRDIAPMMTAVWFSGDLDSIKILVENGVDFMVGNDDLRTVFVFGYITSFATSFATSFSQSWPFCFVQAAHLAASNGMISVLDFLIVQVILLK
jgi:hypothetical protein